MSHVSTSIGGGILRGSRTRREPGGPLHFHINDHPARPVDIFLTMAEAPQWATLIALAFGLAQGDDAAQVQDPTTRDPLWEMTARWRGEADEARAQASIDKDCGDHEGVARNTGRADAINELLRELEAVIGL